tara:strand:+ start:1238 stop:6310 length:5073 start_codon:yes stop_codon:yes gene_type:complete
MEDLQKIKDYGLTSINIDLERQILAIIHRGSDSGELESSRPIRELIQNADDAHSDRIHIRFDSKGLLFENDGLGLEAKKSSDGSVTGTVKAILELHKGSKEEDEMSSGNFGSGFRSTHLFSDSAEIHGISNLDGDLIQYVGICSPFTDNVDVESGRARAKIPVVRGDTSRPKRGFGLVKKEDGSIGLVKTLESSDIRRGVAFYWPWRKEAKNSKWSGMIWDKKRVKESAIGSLSTIPSILLGCRWIREAVVTIDLPGLKSTDYWIRDFNIHEHLNDSNKKKVNIRHYRTNSVKSDAMTNKMNDLTLESTTEFWLISCLDENLRQYASDADLLPSCLLLVPISKNHIQLGSYTPIALTIPSGNNFSPIAFLPAHESRTKIKLDSAIGYPKLIWAASAMNVFCENLLPELFSLSKIAFQNNEISHDQLLQLIARNRPEKWFGSSKLDSHLREISTSWNEYTSMVAESEIFLNENTNSLVSAKDTVRLKIDDNNTRDVIARLLSKLKLSVIDDNKIRILEQLDSEDWGYSSPLEIMDEISSPRELSDLLDEYRDSLNLTVLGNKLVSDLIQVLTINPTDAWDSEDTKLIPTIPDADGKLWPLRDSEGESHFYSASETFPDLLPTSRRIHPKFNFITKSIEFKQAPARELAKLIDEAAREKPQIFNNLQSNKEIHKQVSSALISIIKSDQYRLSTIHEFNFVPCLQFGKIFVRRPNHIGDLIWDVTPGFPERNWENHTHRDFIFADNNEGRSGLNLHPIVENQITWLELHKKYEEEIEDVRKALRIHKVTPQVRGIGLIRALIFAEDGNGISKTKPKSVFERKDGKWELENWIKKKMTKKEIDEVLTSILQLLSDKKRLSGGWGAYPKDKLNSLYLLKDESGEWSRVEELCLELPKKLSKLFERRTIFEGHKNLLLRELLAGEMPTNSNSSGGLGVPERLGEDVILGKIKSLEVSTEKTRIKIIEMMLESEIVWELEELQDIRWVPRLDGELEKLENCMLPTSEITEYFGNKHPWFLSVKIDCDDKNVRKRASELGIICDHKDVYNMHNALIEPDDFWPSMSGNAILDFLRKSFINDPNTILNTKRRERLPDSESKKWEENTWLIDKSIVNDLRRIYPEQKIVAKPELGLSKKGLEMVEKWIIPEASGPEVDTLIEKLFEYSTTRNREYGVVESYWNILEYFSNEEFPSRDYGELLFPLEEEVYSLHEIMIIDERSQITWFQEDHFNTIKTIGEDHNLKDLLKLKFDVVDLSDGTSRLELERQISHMKADNYSQLDIDRYWLILANIGQSDYLFSGANWLFFSTSGFGFCGTSRASPVALIPEKDDSFEEIERMANSRLPLFWLPRKGEIMEKLYDILLPRYNSQLLSERARSEPMDKDQDLSRRKWPALTSSINNVLNALEILETRGYSAIEVKNYKIKNVYQTSESIKSRLFANLSRGSPKVYWKESSESTSILSEIDRERKHLTFTINIHHPDLDDSEIVSELNRLLGADKEYTKKLVRAQEFRWEEEIDSSLAENLWEHQRTEPGMLHPARRASASKDLSQLYGQCQICEQITPANRNGDVQESVVSLFREHGGRYYSKKYDKQHPGNYIYLCPNHFYLYRRSRNQDLLWIPQLDEMVNAIKENPGGGTAKNLVNRILQSTGDINMEVKTFEKRKGDGKARASEQNFEITWKGDHANHFREALTEYLANL